jgi:mono/diheme cytochrome c family protein
MKVTIRFSGIRGAVAVAALLAVSMSSFGADTASRPVPVDRDVQRGEYLVLTSGCHHCHTPGYLATGAMTAPGLLLTGSKMGWRGPWGTTYAANLRLLLQRMTEPEWVYEAKSIFRRPPMPYYSLNSMSEGDLRAMYRYIRSLGPAGEPAPQFLLPDQVPPQPYVQFPASGM